MANKTKSSVLKILYNNLNNNYISGSEIAKKLGITRNAVWKAIKLLQEKGYNIDCISNKGYKLIITTDILSKEAIDYYLYNKIYNKNNFKFNYNIDYFDSISSTNIMLKKFANENNTSIINNSFEGKVYLASHQTTGKGRHGREFFSPMDTGVYFSILLTPSIDPQNSNLITIIASIAVVDAIESVLGINAGIKWVNDIFINNKKVGGILTEASLSIENFGIDYIVLGIGLNIYNPEQNFPDDIRGTAGYILQDYKNNKNNKNNLDSVYDVKNKIVANILSEFYKYYINLNNLEVQELLDNYKNKSCIINKDVVLDTGEDATVLDIGENFELILRLKDGKIKKLSCGEVSIKIK